MKRTFLLPVLAAAMLSLASGCSSDDTPDRGGLGLDAGPRDGSARPDATASDSGPGADGGGMDGTAPDTGEQVITDGGGMDAMTGDAGPGEMCFGDPLVDLNASGTRVGTITTYATDNNNATPTIALLPLPTCADDVAQVVLFGYTPSATGRVRISTNNPGTDFDTVVWALSSCQAGANELACTDDDLENPNDAASTVIVDGTGGTRIIFAAAGYAGDVGQLEITVVEQTTVAVGQPCDPEGILDHCPAPNQCAPSGAAFTCQAPFYAETSIANPMFVDACAAGTRHVLTEADDGHTNASITLPLAFSFFGTARTEIWASTNGYAVFGAAAPLDYTFGAIPEVDEAAAIFAFWQDLDASNAASSICSHATGTAPNRRFYLQWEDFAALDAFDPTQLTFQIVLHETTNIVELQYARLAADDPADEETVDGTLAAIGLQDDQGARYVVHTGTVSTAQGVRFTP